MKLSEFLVGLPGAASETPAAEDRADALDGLEGVDVGEGPMLRTVHHDARGGHPIDGDGEGTRRLERGLHVANGGWLDLDRRLAAHLRGPQRGGGPYQR